MNRRTLAGLSKANLPQWIWACLPFWVGSLIWALDGKTPDWGIISLFIVTVIIIQASAELANTYVDRNEDHIFVPSNPLVTGELTENSAKKALIIENIAAGVLILSLLLITLNYYLIAAMVAGWLIGLAYSLPPLKLKETIASPFSFALSTALVPITAWLLVGSLNDFIIAFAAVLFVGAYGANISTGKLRKTIEALHHGKIRINYAVSKYNIKTVDMNVKIKTAVALEAIAGFSAFVLVAIFWHLGIFDMKLSIALLSVPLIFMMLTVIFRIKDPIKNFKKCVEFAGLSALFIMLSFFALALINVLNWHWGFAALSCIFFLIVFCLLFKQVHPFGEIHRAT